MAMDLLDLPVYPSYSLANRNLNDTDTPELAHVLHIDL